MACRAGTRFGARSLGGHREEYVGVVVRSYVGEEVFRYVNGIHTLSDQTMADGGGGFGPQVVEICHFCL